MKKYLLIILTALFILGCGEKEPPVEQKEEKPVKVKKIEDKGKIKGGEEKETPKIISINEVFAKEEKKEFKDFLIQLPNVNGIQEYLILRNFTSMPRDLHIKRVEDILNSEYELNVCEDRVQKNNLFFDVLIRYKNKQYLRIQFCNLKKKRETLVSFYWNQKVCHYMSNLMRKKESALK